MAWYKDRYRHSLASRGIRTKNDDFNKISKIGKKEKLMDNIRYELLSVPDINKVDIYSTNKGYVIDFMMKESGGYGSPYASVMYYSSDKESFKGEVRFKNFKNEKELEDFKEQLQLEQKNQPSYYYWKGDYGFRFGIYGKTDMYPHLVIQKENIQEYNLLSTVQDVIKRIKEVKSIR